jgi:DnaJ family protein C protein 28
VRESGFDIQRVIELIADRKIEEAMQEGKFDDLPGKGKPLPLDEEWFAPPELRPAIRLLKSAGVLPDWMERAREIERLRAECERLWRIAELEYPRAALLGEARFVEWRTRTWAGIEQVMTRVNALVLAYNCTAPACATPQTPYNLAQQQACFWERFGREVEG